MAATLPQAERKDGKLVKEGDWMWLGMDCVGIDDWGK
jgi:hypothetical protein